MPQNSPPTRHAISTSVLQALLLAALGGSFVGAVDGLLVVEQASVRYAQWGAVVMLVGVLATGAIAAVLAVPAALLAAALFGRPGHRTASPGICAGLGTTAGVGAFVLTGSFSMIVLPALVVGATLGLLALRELLGWWTLLGRATTWWALGTLATAAGGLRLATTVGEGATTALVLCAAAALCAVGCRVLVPRLGHLLVMVGGCALALGGLTVLARAPYPANADRPASDGPNILHVSIDTLRADRVGCYGYENARTPVIDGLAADGVLFEDTTAQANTTGPSHTTMLTGLYPAEHGALHNGRPLHHSVRTLPEVLADAGWETAGFVSGFTLVDVACGLAPRFDWYADNLLSWTWMPQACERLVVVDRVLFRLAARRGEWVTRSDRPAGETVEDTLGWLANRPRAQQAPFYAFVHFYDPHAPYEPPGEDGDGYDWYATSSSEREQIVRDPVHAARMNELYDGEVAYADAQVGRLLKALEAAGELDDTLVILTSDHGEGFGSHAYWFDHGTFLYDEELRVPLILRLPGGEHAGRRIDGQTRLLDLTPTVLEVVGLEPETPTSGASLLPLLDAAATLNPRPSFGIAEMAGNISGFDLIGRRLSLRSAGHKLIWTSSHWNDTERIPETYELFSLAADPDEQRNLLNAAHPAPSNFAELREQLDAWRDAIQAAGSDKRLSADVADQLRLLGYL